MSQANIQQATQISTHPIEFFKGEKAAYRCGALVNIHINRFKEPVGRRLFF